MNRNDAAFIGLFKEACEKCFGSSLSKQLSETDSRLLSNRILESTGLVVGYKSLKNYSQFVVKPDQSKKENPSIATLDTLARYVLAAPYTDEIKRKDHEPHFPYWYHYRARYSPATASGHSRLWLWTSGLLIITIGLLLGWLIARKSSGLQRIIPRDQ